MGLSHTVSGNIASFRTPSRVPIESLKFHFLPKQEGSGDPSPTNVRPITGWTGLNGKRCHKNIIKPYYSVVTVKNGLTITPTTNGIRISGTAESRTPCFICTTDNIKLGIGDKVAFSLYVNGDISECENPFLGYYKSIGVWGAVIYSFSSSDNWNHTIWTVPNTYTDISYIDSYIYIPQGVTVDFEIGLQGIISSYYSDDYEPYSGEQIPITFPANCKNRYNYDESNVEEGFTTTTGYTRAVYHTGVFGDGRKVSISGSIIEEGVVSNTSLNVGYLKDGIVTVQKAFISYINGSITSSSFVVPNGYEFVIITTNESGWGIKRNLPRYNIQIEYADSPTTYEPYSSDNTFYGGYIDPVAGEIVAEYYLARAKKSDFGSKSTPSGTGRDYRQTQSIFPKTDSGVEWAIARQQQKFNRGIIANPWSEASYGENIGVIVTQDSMNPVITYMRISEEVYQAMNDDDYAEISYKLREPIHIPFPAEDMKAFLDHNNFWSDTNDITEVTYPVIESKDIVAIHKKAQTFNDYFQGELVFELNGDDAPVDGKWIERVNGYPFELIYDASYDSENKIYNFSNYGLAVKRNGSGNNPINLGNHFRVEWDVYYNRSNSPTSYIMDIGSLTSADRAIGFKLLPKNSSNITPNWKMYGNESNPFSYSNTENQTHPTEILANGEYAHLVGFHEIIPYNHEYDIFRLKINDKIKKYSTMIPKANYGPPWNSSITWVSVGGGAYNIGYWTAGTSPNREYITDIKIKSIKIYKYD